MSSTVGDHIIGDTIDASNSNNDVDSMDIDTTNVSAAHARPRPVLDASNDMSSSSSSINANSDYNKCNGVIRLSRKNNPHFQLQNYPQVRIKINYWPLI